MTAAAFDVHATLARLFVYPVKSCAGVELSAARLTDTGLALDRAWMVVDAGGGYVTQRQLPRMALVRPRIRPGGIVLRAPGMPALPLASQGGGPPVRVTLWGEAVAAFDLGDAAARWFGDFLSQPGRPQALRLVRFDPGQRRLSSRKWTGDVAAPNQFSDGFPLLVVGEGSLAELNRRLVAAGHAAVGIERFRPNLVLAGLEPHDEDYLGALHIGAGPDAVRLGPVKPCARCPIADTDPRTAVRSPEVGDTLRGYRQDARVGGGATFGMNTVVLQGVGRTLAVGQPVSACYRFE